MLEKSVGEESWGAVLEKSAVEKCWRQVFGAQCCRDVEV